MSRGKPNYFARVVAIMALVGAFALVIATIATSGGDGDEDDSALNSDIDPQALIAGQRVSLRPGQAGSGGDSTTTDSTDTTEDPADEFGDGSVADDNSSSSDGISP